MANENAARLRIDADGADVRAVFASVVRTADEANARLIASSQRAAQKQRTELRNLQREYATLALNIKRLGQAHEQMTAASQRRVTAIQRSEQRARDKDADAAVTREAVRTARIEAIKAESAARITRMEAREERNRVRERERAARSSAGGGGGDGRGPYGNGRYRTGRADVTLNALGGVRAFANDMHGQIQGARATRAQTETSLNDAFVQAVSAGLSQQEASALRAQVLTFARQNGLREEDLAPAINEAQTRFAVISNAGIDGPAAARPTARRDAVANLLETARLARLTGNDTTETARFFGAMTARGMDSASALAATRQAIAAGFSGSVSLGEVSAQALGSLSQSVATQQSGVTDSGERARIAQQAVAQFFANLQMQASVGARAGVSAHRLVGLESFATNGAKTQLMYNRLREHFRGNRAALANLDTLFVDAGHGRRAVRSDAQDPTTFAAALGAMFGGNATAFRNVMGARGNWSKEAGGRNQVMSAPLVEAMANVMAVGPDALQQRNRIMQSDLDPATLRTIAQIRGNEDTTELNRAAQENRDALRDNSRSIVQLSDRFASWSASNPFTASAFTALGGALGGGFLARVGVFQWGGGGGRMPGVPGGAPGIPGGAGLPGAAPGAFGLSGAGLVGGGLLAAAMTGAALYQVNEEHNARTGTTLTQRLNDEEGAYASARAHQQRLDSMRGVGSFGMSPAQLAERDRSMANVLGANAPSAVPTLDLSERSIQLLATAWSNSGVRVTIDPHDSAHVGSNNNTHEGQ